MGTMDGRTGLVTGGSRGIGLAIAQSLVDRGARVVLTARKADALAEAVESLGGPEVAVAVPGHAGDAEHRAEAVRTAVETFGSLDMLVGNVGVNPVYGPMVDLELDAFRKILDTNVVSSLGLVQEAWKAWMKQHGGSVLFVASVAGLRSSENIAAYGVSKAAVINLTTQLAVELGPTVRVNAVAPGGREDPLRRRALRGPGGRGGGAVPGRAAGRTRGRRRGRRLPARRRRRLGHRPDPGARRRTAVASVNDRAQLRPSTRARTSSGSSSSR